MRKYLPWLIYGWIFSGLLFAVKAHSAVLSVPIPDGCVPQVSGYTVTCAGTATPPPVTTPPPTTTPPQPGGSTACSNAGYSMSAIELPYPTHGNTQVATTGTFGNYNAIIVHFKTPPVGVNDQATFQPAGFAPTQNTNRVYVLGVVPCLFGPGASAVTVISSQSPAINIKIGTCASSNPVICSASGSWLLPNTDYYVTMVNRTGVNGQPSCAVSSCPMRLDFDQ